MLVYLRRSMQLYQHWQRSTPLDGQLDGLHAAAAVTITADAYRTSASCASRAACASSVVSSASASGSVPLRLINGDAARLAPGGALGQGIGSAACT